MAVCRAMTVLLVVPIAAVAAAENPTLHLSTLRDACRSHSQPLPKGELRATIRTPHHGLATRVHMQWDGDFEYVDVTDYRGVGQDTGERSPSRSAPGPRRTRSVTGPDGTMLLHLPHGDQLRAVAHVHPRKTRRVTDGDVLLHPDPHRTWYQMTWQGELPWTTVLDCMISGELAVDVQATNCANGDVRLDFTNAGNGYRWQLTYSPDSDLRITSYGPPEPELQSTWKWDEDAEGNWFLREYRYVPARTMDEPAERRRPYVLTIDTFDANPKIAADRFRFASLPTPDGTLLVTHDPRTSRPVARVVGESAPGTGRPLKVEFESLADVLRRGRFQKGKP